MNHKVEYKLSEHNFIRLVYIPGGLSSTSLVQVFVIDTNDNAPVFYPQQYNISVRQSAEIGLPLLVVSATDLDTGIYGNVHYSLVDRPALFRVDEHTGNYI